MDVNLQETRNKLGSFLAETEHWTEHGVLRVKITKSRIKNKKYAARNLPTDGNQISKMNNKHGAISGMLCTVPSLKCSYLTQFPHRI